MFDWNSVIAITALLGVGGSTIMFAMKFGQTNLKVDTMWGAFLRARVSDAVQHGTATVNSPVKITEKGKELMEPFACELREFYATLKTPISDSDLALKLEARFGEQITRDLHIPAGAPGWIIMAVAVAKGVDTVDFVGTSSSER